MIGLDLPGLGSPHWKIKETVKVWPAGFAVSCFDNTWPKAFGDPRKNLRAILNTGRCPAMLIQGWWSYQHKIVPLDILKKRLPAWEAFAKSTPPEIGRYFSHSCEYSEGSAAEVKKRIDLVRKLAPSWIPVNTPMNSPGTPGVIQELHGRVNAGPNQIASYDGGKKGEGIYDYDAAKWVRDNGDSIMHRLWFPESNGVESHNELTPDKRTAFPGGRMLKAIARLGLPEGEAPQPQFDAIPFADPTLYKSFAENMQGENSRDSFPLIIVKGTPSSADIITFDGKKIGAMIRFGHAGEYPGGLTRYYAGLPGGIKLFGAEIGQKALATSGSEFVWFKVGARIYGPVNPAFRRGFFR